MTPVKYAEEFTDGASLSRPASGKHLKIEAQQVVDKDINHESYKVENSNPQWP